MDTNSGLQQQSWRDPDGFVVKHEGKILRAVVPQKAEQMRTLLSAPWVLKLIERGLMPGTREVSDPKLPDECSISYLWLEHEPVVFPAYPHEITALQLYDSAQLTIKIAIEAAREGWVLKDASAWNVLHSMGRAVFIDFLSFEKLEPTATWVAYGQFVRHFLLPLLLYRKLAMTPTEIFQIHRDGIPPERAYQLLRGFGLLSATGLELVILPKLLAGSGSRMISARRQGKATVFDSAAGLPLFLGALSRLQRVLERLRPDHLKSKSVWGEYEETRHHYSEADLAAKADFVRRHVGGAGSVLDLGCNAGEFSLLAAASGNTVVAADGDELALSRLYSRIRDTGQAISPLFLNIGRPTPALGWENRETESFLQRAQGHFGCVLFLGLIHHLLVSERATLPMIAELLDRIAAPRVILEWVDPKDPKFQQVAGLNASLYTELDAERLEACMGLKYAMIEKLPLPCGTRVMYVWGR